MQIFKLVRGGQVDQVLGFDELPEAILSGVRRGPIAGFSRAWRDFMGVKWDDKAAQPFYILEYISKNADREKWQEISSYVKRNVEPSVRLLDKIEAMAVKLAPDSYTDVTLEPEEVPIIPFPKNKGPLVEEPKPRRYGKKSEEAVTA